MDNVTMDNVMLRGGADNTKKNIILLGGSNSVMVNGLQKGIREGIAKLNEGKDEKEQLEFYNFALGATNSIRNLYEIIRHKYLAKNAELVITESNVNDITYHFHSYHKLSYQHIYRYLNWFFKELYFLNTKILVLILPYPHNDHKTITNIHKKLCKQYGFNFIDMQEYYEANSLVEFGRRVDIYHTQARIMCEMGKNIISGINDYRFPKSLKITNDNPKFVICTPKDMELVSGELQEIPMKNSAFNEVTYRIKKDTKLKFPDKFIGFQPIGIHTWNNTFEWSEYFEFSRNTPIYSSLVISNQNQRFSKESSFFNFLAEIQNQSFKIDNESLITLNMNIAFYEYHTAVHTWHPNAKRVSFFDLISIFLSKGGNFYTEEIDFESLANENIEIEEKYNFNHLIPDIKLYKEIIDEYCARMDPKKLAPLQKQLTQKDSELQSKNQALDLKTKELESLKSQYDSKIKELQVNLKTTQDSLSSLPIKKQTLEIKNLESDLNIKVLKAKKLEQELKLNTSFVYLPINLSAKDRIHNHLSYKLGKAMIENSKSILGYIRMPYVLSYIKEQHNQEQKRYQEQIKKNPNLKLPKLESYKDYKEALKEKECFTYKLGEALMKADKTWYKGGYVKLWFEAKRLEREYREKRGG